MEKDKRFAVTIVRVEEFEVLAPTPHGALERAFKETWMHRSPQPSKKIPVYETYVQSHTIEEMKGKT